MRYITNFLIILSVYFIISSCKHNNFSDFVGPAICPTKDFHYINDFSVGTTATNKNFIYGADTISATFSEVVTWTVTLTGNTSGAQKIYSGKSDAINILWYGNSNSLTFFTQEDVNVTLQVACKDPLTKTITIANLITFQNMGNFGVLVGDFEGNGNVHNGYVPDSTKTADQAPLGSGYNSKGWSSFYSSPNKITKLQIVSSPLAAPQGNKYLTFQGYSGPTSWFVGGMYVNSPVSMPASKASDVYFNAIVSSGTNTTTSATIVMNASGIAYKKTIIIDWKGWKIISLKLSEFVGDFPLSEATSVSSIEFDLGPAGATGQSVEFDIDFITLTAYEPFFN